MDLNYLIGLAEVDAIEYLMGGGFTYRIWCRDGEPAVMTMDYDANRINLEINNGIVTNFYVG